MALIREDGSASDFSKKTPIFLALSLGQKKL